MMNVVLKNSSDKDYVLNIPNYFCGKDITIVSNCFAPDDMENAMSQLRKSQYKYATESFSLANDTISLTFPYYDKGKVCVGFDQDETSLDDILSYIDNYENIRNYSPENGLSSLYIIPQNGQKSITLDINILTHLNTTWVLSFLIDNRRYSKEARNLIEKEGLEIYAGYIVSDTICFSTKGKLIIN